jgi:ABC-2 type transport system permease protein
LFGNVFNLGEVIAKGRLDYYLSMPRPVLLHTVASRSIASGLGDFSYGFVSYALSGQYTWNGLGRFLIGTLAAAAIFAAFMILVQSLAFWIGNTAYLSSMALNAIITFAIYPITLFDNTAKLILFTLIPAALMGALPAQFVHSFTWGTLMEIFLGSSIFLGLAVAVFRLGLRRYESGSGIQVEV